MKNENADKNRHTIWLTNEAWSTVICHYRKDNCSAHNEYIEKAIQFYSGYLDTQNADSYLPRVLSDVLEGKLGALGGRPLLNPRIVLRKNSSPCPEFVLMPLSLHRLYTLSVKAAG